MTNKLYYKTKDNTISLDKNNWIKPKEQKRTNEDSFFTFSLASNRYLIHQWKDYVPKCFKKENDIIYSGDFHCIYDSSLIFCEEWKVMEEKDKIKVQELLKELREVKGGFC
jgi:hypothetical protein